jgi:hypothetical protein
MLLALAVEFSNALSGIAVNPDTSKEPEILLLMNAATPNDCKDNVGQNNPVPPVPVPLNAKVLILVMVDGRVPDSFALFANAKFLIIVRLLMG